MQGNLLFGWPWWAWALLAIGIGVIAAFVRKASARASHRAATEALAQKADAEHEGAQTRHEGGA